jgi:FdhE protein
VTTLGRSRSVAAAFEARSARAELLARGSPAIVVSAEARTSAEEPLRFVAGLAHAQASVAAALEALHGAKPLTGRLEADAERVLASLLDVPRFAARHAPSPLADEALTRATEDADAARKRLAVFWSGDLTSADDYLSRAMLRPYVEVLRALGVAPDREHRQGHCPFCGGSPVVGCRRGGSEGEGALRFLVCALCGLEWPISRILCPSCFENDPHKLPSFTSEMHPIVRIEACETCRRYVKSLDLSQDARPIPEVDDLASLALDLWAIEQGFTRLEPGLAGV